MSISADVSSFWPDREKARPLVDDELDDSRHEPSEPRSQQPAAALHCMQPRRASSFRGDAQLEPPLARSSNSASRTCNRIGSDCADRQAAVLSFRPNCQGRQGAAGLAASMGQQMARRSQRATDPQTAGTRTSKAAGNEGGRVRRTNSDIRYGKDTCTRLEADVLSADEGAGPSRPFTGREAGTVDG